MLNRIWAGMVLLSFFCAVVTGRMQELSQAVLAGSRPAVELTLSMAGMMCAWTGPDCAAGGEAIQAVSLNITANLLGLGNAATPLGIAAMKAMVKEKPTGSLPNRSMIRFVVLNTASIQLIPTYIATLRAQYGSQSPFDITPAVWLVSAAALTAALGMCFILERGGRHRG